MNSAIQMYALSLAQIQTAILRGGSKRTILVQGHMGSGKSSLLGSLSRELPNHTPCYFDCTTKDLGDITIPKLSKLDDADYVTYATNEELGAHLNGPIVLMFDEFDKGNRAVKNSLLRVILERKIGAYTLHRDSIVFATSNLGAEGVGDLVPPHARNRMTVVTLRQADNMEWIEWAINNRVDHTLLGYCKDNPHLFYGFEDVKNPDDNPCIYHPKQQRVAFVTGRSLEAASDWLKMREHFDDQTLTGLLMGTIGERAAMDLMAFVKMADQLPTLQSIKDDPHNAKVPNSAAAVCMVVYRSLSSMGADWIDAWMDYMMRLDKEAQGMFANGCRTEKYMHRKIVMTNKKFTRWAMDHNYMFAADKQSLRCHVKK